jgi:magnesium chelatase family protein
VPPLDCGRLAGTGGAEGSGEVRERVARARERQASRGSLNARLRGATLRRHCALDPEGRGVLTQAAARLGLSARAHDRILRVARTIADLESAEGVLARHLLEAIQYRALDRPTQAEDG